MTEIDVKLLHFNTSKLVLWFLQTSVFGEGTYLSSELSVCFHYSPMGISWNKSVIGSMMSCVALCEMIDDESVKCKVHGNMRRTCWSLLTVFFSFLITVLLCLSRMLSLQCLTEKVKVRTFDIVPFSGTPPQKRSGMARVLKGSHSFTCTPTRSSTIGMSHTCLCLPIYSCYPFTDPGGMEGWVCVGGWLVGYVVRQFACQRQSPIPLVTGLNVEQLRWPRPTSYHYPKPPPVWTVLVGWQEWHLAPAVPKSSSVGDLLGTQVAIHESRLDVP